MSPRRRQRNWRKLEQAKLCGRATNFARTAAVGTAARGRPAAALEARCDRRADRSLKQHAAGCMMETALQGQGDRQNTPNLPHHVQVAASAQNQPARNSSSGKGEMPMTTASVASWHPQFQIRKVFPSYSTRSMSVELQSSPSDQNCTRLDSRSNTSGCHSRGAIALSAVAFLRPPGARHGSKEG